MTAYNAGAILQGLNNGVVDAWKFGINQDRIDRQEARQAAIDKQNAEAHALNMRRNQMVVDEAERELTERKGARQAATPQKAEDGFAVGKTGSQNFYKDEAAARAAAEDQAFIDGVDAPQAPRQATAVSGGGKPQIGAFGMKADNSRIGTAKRIADYWRGLGETDKADQIEMQAKETDRKFYDAAREEVWRTALIASKDGPQAFVDALYKSYNDGFDARVVPGPNGGGRVVRIGPDGKPAGAIDFKNMDDLAAQAYQLVFPDRAYEARAASRAELAKELAKKPVESVPDGYYDKATGRFVRTRAAGDQVIGYNSDGDPIYGKAAGSGSSSGKAGATPLSQASDLWETVATKSENKLPTDQFARGYRVVEELVGGGATPAVAVDAAMAVVTNPKAARLELNTESGTVDLVYQNKEINGGRPMRVAAGAGTIAELEKSAGRDVLRTEVAKMVAKDYGDNAGKMIEIAADPSLAKEYLNQARDKGLDVEAIANRLNLIRSYLPPESRESSRGDQKPGGRSLLDALRDGRGSTQIDPNSRAGKFQERQKELERERQRAEAAKSERSRQVSEQFNQDKNSMSPIEFVRKYDSIRSQLGKEDLLELRRIEELAFQRK